MGRVTAESDGVALHGELPGRQGRLLFARLVEAQRKPVRRDELVEVLWEDAPPASWESALRVLVSKLRAALEGHAELSGTGGGYRLELPPGTWVDVRAAEEATHEAEEQLAAGALDGATAAATLAESLLREPFLSGDDGAWVEARRRDLDGLRARIVDLLAEAYLLSGRAEASVRWAEQAVATEPFRESGYRRLMEAHVAAGNRAEALRVYDRCRRLLADDLGAYPSPETEAIYRRLLEEPPTLEPITARTASDTPATPPPNPRRRRLAFGAAALLAAGAVAGVLALARPRGSAPAIVPNSVVRIDPTTLEVTQVVPVGVDPDLIVLSGGYLWVTNHVLRGSGTSEAPRYAGDHTLTRVDPATGTTVVVGGGLAPCGIARDPSGDIWVANCYPPLPGLRDDVVRVGAQSLAFEKTFAAPGGEGFFRGLAYGGGSVWVSQIAGGELPNPDAVTQIDPQTGKERTIRLTRAASALAWSGSYGELWIDNFDDGSLTRLQAATGATATIDRVADSPAFPIVNGSVVWIADWTTPQVVRLSAVGSSRPRRIPLPGDTTGVWSVAAGAGAVWATTPGDRALWRIDPKTNRVTRLSLPYRPIGVAADANDVWVTLRR